MNKELVMNCIRSLAREGIEIQGTHGEDNSKINGNKRFYHH